MLKCIASMYAAKNRNSPGLLMRVIKLFFSYGNETKAPVPLSLLCAFNEHDGTSCLCAKPAEMPPSVQDIHSSHFTILLDPATTNFSNY